MSQFSFRAVTNNYCHYQSANFPVSLINSLVYNIRKWSEIIFNCLVFYDQKVHDPMMQSLL